MIYIKKMSETMKTTKTARIWLPYFKQGDDMNSCLVRDEKNKLNVKASFENHINLLKSAIELLEGIKNSLPEDGDFDIDADTHMISITGDRNIIEKLQNNKLLENDFSSDDCSESDNISDISSDPDDN